MSEPLAQAWHPLAGLVILLYSCAGAAPSYLLANVLRTLLATWSLLDIHCVPRAYLRPHQQASLAMLLFKKSVCICILASCLNNALAVVKPVRQHTGTEGVLACSIARAAG